LEPTLPEEIEKKPRQPRSVMRENARNQIIDIATTEFVDKGLAGARIDEIAGKATKRKIYYYFEGKDDLYRAVLERAYKRVRESEQTVDIEHGTAPEVLRRLIEHDFAYHSEHQDLVRLVMNENIHQGVHIGEIAGIQDSNRSVIELIQKIIDRGVAEGSFRTDIDPVDLHMTMSALSFYNVSNRYTFSHNFGADMTSEKAIRSRASRVADIILAWVTATD
jgi:AcrR family transcriptional regulator